jgi:hypothetical protein
MGITSCRLRVILCAAATILGFNAPAALAQTSTGGSVDAKPSNSKSMRAMHESASHPDRNDPQLLAERARNEQILKRGVPALAFVDHPLKHEAVAEIFLGQHQEPSRFIVVQRQSFSDNVLDTAMEVVLKWQRDVPDDPTPMKAVLFKDGRYEIQWGNHQSSGTMVLHRMGSAAEMMSPELLARAATATPVVVPGVGQVRLVALSK